MTSGDKKGAFQGVHDVVSGSQLGNMKKCYPWEKEESNLPEHSS